ncbi:MAG TPA: TIGR03087 family PEP-CTERM/XrtA system glycosyltransferase [Gammaproteobacteria bacterium]|nr:TIGR03087 family PEP-CTERM/XrtA system glycosyltransferase [Gammaproteobacteria bacterium]
MHDILFITHRIPFPPDKGDKIRSYHILKHLAARYRVHLGTFIDDSLDREYIGELRRLCASVCAININPRLAKLRSLAGLLTGEPLTVRFYRSRALRKWVRQVLHENDVVTALFYCSGVAQFAPDDASLRRIMDFVDVDSAKWRQYADDAAWPLRYIHIREAKRLARVEQRVAAAFDYSLFASPAEADFFRRHTPGCEGRIHGMSNGVDADAFDPNLVTKSPYSRSTSAVVFTGMMDYRANVEGVSWFASEVWPRIRERCPQAAFYIVGARPTRAVRALGKQPGVQVTGRVPDVKPYVKYAHVAVAPLRIARGIQNKVLEAQALGTPVVGTPEAFQGIGAFPDRARVTASSAPRFAQAVINVIATHEPAAPDMRLRQFVRQHYDWNANLALLDELLASPGQATELPRGEPTDARLVEMHV